MNISKHDYNVDQGSEHHGDPIVYNFNCLDTIDLQRITTQKPQLKLNNVGKTVFELQQMLQMLRYLKGNIDGYFGQGTKEAVKKFQISYHLRVDGIVDIKTWEALDKAIKKPKKTPHHTLRIGDENENVKELQNKFKSLGYFHQCATGTFCEETKLRVKQFQENNNLTIDGIVGKRTWQVLDTLFFSTDVSLDTLEEPVFRGVFGESIKVLQRNLKTIGCYNGEVNGHFGIDTTNAVEQFQSMYRLPKTGSVDRNTWQTLIETVEKPKTVESGIEVEQHSTLNSERSISLKPLLQKGDVGEAVNEVQIILKKLLYYNGAIDSIFDTVMESAVQAFQIEHNLKADGSIGPQTWDALHSSLATVSSSTPLQQKHTVNRGDTLNSIADKYKTTVDNLKTWNHLSSDFIMINQSLTVTPKYSDSSTNNTTSKKREVVSSDKKKQPYFMYTVQSGDYLSKLANTYNTTVEAIEALNHQTCDFLFVGQQLKIPITPTI